MMSPHSVHIETHLIGGPLRNIGIDRRHACAWAIRMRLSGAAAGFRQALCSTVRNWSAEIRRTCTVCASRPAAVALAELPVAVVRISVYPGVLYDEQLGGQRNVSLQVMNRAVVVTGKIWFNFKSARLFRSRCAGRSPAIQADG